MACGSVGRAETNMSLHQLYDDSVDERYGSILWRDNSSAIGNRAHQWVSAASYSHWPNLDYHALGRIDNRAFGYRMLAVVMSRLCYEYKSDVVRDVKMLCF